MHDGEPVRTDPEIDRDDDTLDTQAPGGFGEIEAVLSGPLFRLRALLRAQEASANDGADQGRRW